MVYAGLDLPKNFSGTTMGAQGRERVKQLGDG